MISDRLQKLPDQYHWVLSDGALLQAISRNESLVRGIQARLLGALVKVSRRLGLVWPLLWLVGMLELIRLLLRQSSTARNRKGQSDNYPENYPGRFFVGFGAGKEEEIFKRYWQPYSGKVGKLNQIDIGSFATWHRVGIVSGFRALVNALATAKMAITELPDDLEPWRADFLTYVGMRVGYFAYMRAWFEILKTKTWTRLDEVAFLTGYIPAFAAVDAGLPTCYLQHGMIRHSGILPAFTRVEALTADEATFIRHRLPKTHVTTHSQSRQKLVCSQMVNEILVASIYGEPEYISLIVPFIRWAHTKKIQMRVRPHPCEDGTFWPIYEAAGYVTIEKDDAGFFQAIDRFRPRLVISWFSTAMIEALECGVIPVSVCVDDDVNVADMVYPLYRHCMRWPNDADSIAQLLHDDEYYASELSRLREGLRGC